MDFSWSFGIVFYSNVCGVPDLFWGIPAGKKLYSGAIDAGGRRVCRI